VKGGIIHDNNAVLGELWNQVLDHPRIKDLGVDGGGKEAHREKSASQKGSNDIGATLCTPILDAITSFSSWCISMGPWHVMGKPALVKGYNGFTCLFIGCQCLAEGKPLFGICPGVCQGFFYMSLLSASKRAICPFV
jgi:hypothetical protein